MTFVKKTWLEDGTTPITAAELNRMETGIDDANDQLGAPVWNDLTLQNGATAVSGFTLQYAKVGPIVHLRGELAAAVIGGTLFATLPADARPTQDFMYLTSLNTNVPGDIAKITIGANGSMTLTARTLSAGTFINTSFITG